MRSSNQFDYQKYQLAVKIYQYAERLVTDPNDEMNISYLRREAADGLTECRKNHINWSPEAHTCKGKKLAGRISVEVRTWEDTAYGFSHYSENGNKIYRILLDMWTKYIHGEEIEQILSVS